MTETRVHPETGALLHRDVRKQTIRVGSLSQVVEVPGWYPEDEGDAIHTGADLKVSDEAFKALRGSYGARVRAVRKKLKLTQEQAGAIIGGGKRAFQKYESGNTEPSYAAIGLIEVLDRHPEVVETLRDLRLTETKLKPVVATRVTASRALRVKRRLRRPVKATA